MKEELLLEVEARVRERVYDKAASEMKIAIHTII
jgi:hypothetical protein